MRIKKACMVCQENIGIYNCRICGRLICIDHYDKIRGICTGCLENIHKLTGRKV